MGGNGVCVSQVGTLALELVEIGVGVLVDVLETNGNADGVPVGDDARAGKVGEDDNVASALLCTEEQAVRNMSNKTIENLFKLIFPRDLQLSLDRYWRLTARVTGGWAG
jgi:hypothetical protein